MVRLVIRHDVDRQGRPVTDRHLTAPRSIRLPDALEVWVQAESERTGKPVRRIILEALGRASNASRP
jgi:hypothetical protein